MGKMRLNRDHQNIPVREIDKVIRQMPYPMGLDPIEKKALVTMYLNQSTIRYFKKQAEKHHTKYQRLMRAVLDRYAALRD